MFDIYGIFLDFYVIQFKVKIEKFIFDFGFNGNIMGI